MSKLPKRKRADAPRVSASSPSSTKGQSVEARVVPAGPGGRLSRMELAVVVVVLVCGLALRFAWPDRMAVEHFDEGVYASNLWFGAESGGQYPARQLYAPPLVPSLIEGSLLAEQVIAGNMMRPSGLSAMFPNLLAGCVTLLIVWWVSRAWFGSAAAIASTTLAAASEFHALYSRTALTDVMLLPWMLLAVYLFERAISTRQARLLLFAGLACGLAWWTKYNGWLPLLIGLGGIILRLVFVPASWRSAGRDAMYWVGFAAIAFLVWSPFLWSLQTTGGYAEVMQNHRGYVVGPSGWISSLGNQLANLVQFEGWTSCLGPAFALLVVWFVDSRSSSRSEQSDRAQTDLLIAFVFAAVLVALATWFGLAVVIMFLSIVGLYVVGIRARAEASIPSGSDSLAIWLITAWFSGLFVLTPLYSPYPRLTLTWLCAGWLAAGMGVDVLFECCQRGADGPRFRAMAQRFGGRPGLTAVLLVSSVSVYWTYQRVADRGFPAWQDRTGLRDAANLISEQIDVENSVVFVQGEPGLFYQLRAARIVAVPGFDFNVTPATLPFGVDGYLATGLHAHRSDDFQRQLAQAGARLEEVGSFPCRPSDLVLLNNYRAQQLEPQRRANWQVKLYRLK